MDRGAWLDAALSERRWRPHYRRAVRALAAAADDGDLVFDTVSCIARQADTRPAVVDKVIMRLLWSRRLRVLGADVQPRAYRKDRSDFRAKMLLKLVAPMAGEGRP
jgi:hypothetical protein